MFLLERDDRGRFRARTFGTRFGTSSVVHLLFGPGPRGTSLYYTTFVRGGEVRRISYAGGNRRPTAAVAAAPRFGPVPLEVRFDARRSSDPDGGEGLTYLWDFGDGSSLETAAPVVRHSYGAEGTYFAELRVRDAEGALSDPRRTRIDAGNSPPAITVRGPRRYRFGERVVLRATARDPEDGPLAAGGLAWHILLHHERHTHPFLDPVTGGRLVFDAPRLEDRHAVRTTFLRVTVRATDSRGLSGKATWDLRPRVRRRRGR